MTLTSNGETGNDHPDITVVAGVHLRMISAVDSTGRMLLVLVLLAVLMPGCSDDNNTGGVPVLPDGLHRWGTFQLGDETGAVLSLIHI